MEQAMMEVEEEEEMRAMAEAKNEFLDAQQKEKSRVEELEREQMKRYKEKEELVAREEAKLEREMRVLNKIDALEKSILTTSTLKENVIRKLESKGYFSDPIVQDIKENFMPWLAVMLGNRVDIKW
jgi:hypothetical protein